MPENKNNRSNTAKTIFKFITLFVIVLALYVFFVMAASVAKSSTIPILADISLFFDVLGFFALLTNGIILIYPVTKIPFVRSFIDHSINTTIEKYIFSNDKFKKFADVDMQFSNEMSGLRNIMSEQDSRIKNVEDDVAKIKAEMLEIKKTAEDSYKIVKCLATDEKTATEYREELIRFVTESRMDRKHLQETLEKIHVYVMNKKE